MQVEATLSMHVRLALQLLGAYVDGQDLCQCDMVG